MGGKNTTVKIQGKVLNKNITKPLHITTNYSSIIPNLTSIATIILGVSILILIIYIIRKYFEIKRMSNEK
ncbi:hypothetical protein M1145_02355 [Patescibacteria group bacterium]|nr:hypothetical protein [Patescibacteria group bacterium]